VTLLQAYSDRRLEVVDTRESVKQLERAFPFADCRLIELVSLIYENTNGLILPLQGEIGYSCSYHVALWLQLAGIPCWLRGSNLFYQQKSQALQTQSNFKAFLREPRLADHVVNLEQRQLWQEQLSAALLSAKRSYISCEFYPLEERELNPWRFKGNRLNEWSDHAMAMEKRAMLSEGMLTETQARLDTTLLELSCCKAEQDELQAQVVELDNTNQSQKLQAEAANAELVSKAVEVNELHGQILVLNAQIVELDSAGQSLKLQAEAANAELALKSAEVDELLGRIVALNTQVTELGNISRSQKLQAEAATTKLATKNAETDDLLERIAALNTQVTELGNICHGQKIRADNAETELALRNVEVDKLRRQHTALENHITSLLNTRSWRITKPLRIIATFLKGGLIKRNGN
jgi:hypothetical protein